MLRSNFKDYPHKFSYSSLRYQRYRRRKGYHIPVTIRYTATITFLYVPTYIHTHVCISSTAPDAVFVFWFLLKPEKSPHVFFAFVFKDCRGSNVTISVTSESYITRSRCLTQIRSFYLAVSLSKLHICEIGMCEPKVWRGCVTDREYVPNTVAAIIGGAWG